MVAFSAPGTACTAAAVTAASVPCSLACSRCNVRASSLITVPKERLTAASPTESTIALSPVSGRYGSEHTGLACTVAVR